MNSQDPTYPSLQDRTVRNGGAVLYLRRRSSRWQASLRRTTGDWFTLSTGTQDLEEAKCIAEAKFDEMCQDQKDGGTGRIKTFKDVAQQTIQELQAELDAGTGKSVYSHYILAINKYLIPCLGQVIIQKIDYGQLLRLDQYRTHKLGRIPNHSTISTHNAALNRIFETALIRGYMSFQQIPKFHNKGAKPKSRPYFNEEEFKIIKSKLEEFTKIGRKRETREIRKLLRDYVLILAYTGMRTGKEALSLKWRNIRIQHLKDGSTGLEFCVCGKTGWRTLIAQNSNDSTIECLQRIKSRDRAISSFQFDQVFNLDRNVFLTTNGKIVRHQRIAKHFSKFLATYGLNFSQYGETRTLYSLRHMYATSKIINGIDIETLSIQMGTSIGMLEKFYNKLKPHMKFELLSKSNNFRRIQ